MKRKTINAILTKKANDWLKHVEDLEVQQAIKRDIIITGGCITSMLLNEEPKDFDVYFRTQETASLVAKYYVEIFKRTHPQYNDDNFKVVEESDRVRVHVRSKGVVGEKEVPLGEPFEDVFDTRAIWDTTANTGMGVESFKELPIAPPETQKKAPYRPVFFSSNAITLANQIQIVVRFTGEPDVIHTNYDFVHCTNYWTYRGTGVVFNPLALEATLAKELVYQGSKYPLCSVIRTRKFIKRGWNINAGQYLKMLFQVSKLDLEDIEVLEDQLIGVDSAYFNMLISGLKTKSKQDPSFVVTGDYLAEIIDRIF